MPISYPPTGGGGSGGQQFTGTSGATVPFNSLPGTTIVSNVGSSNSSSVLSLVDDSNLNAAVSGQSLTVGVEPPQAGIVTSPFTPIVESQTTSGDQGFWEPVSVACSNVTATLTNLTLSNATVIAGVAQDGYPIATVTGRWVNAGYMPSVFQLTTDMLGTPYTGTLVSIRDAARNYWQAQNQTVDMTLQLLTGPTAWTNGQTLSIYIQENAAGTIRYTAITLTGATAVAPSALSSSNGTTLSVVEYAFTMVTYPTVISGTWFANDQVNYSINTSFGDGALLAFDIESFSGRLYVSGPLVKATKASYSIQVVATGITGSTATLNLTINIASATPANIFTNATIGTTVVEDWDASLTGNVTGSGASLSIAGTIGSTPLAATRSSATYTAGTSFNLFGTGGLRAGLTALLNLWGVFPTNTFVPTNCIPFFAYYVVKTSSLQGIITAIWSSTAGQNISSISVGTDHVTFGSSGPGVPSGTWTSLVITYGGFACNTYQNNVAEGSIGANNVAAVVPSDFLVGIGSPSATSGGAVCQIAQLGFGTGTPSLLQLSQFANYVHTHWPSTPTPDNSSPINIANFPTVTLKQLFDKPDANSLWVVNGGVFNPRGPDSQSNAYMTDQPLLDSGFIDQTSAITPKFIPFFSQGGLLTTTTTKVPAVLRDELGTSAPLRSGQTSQPGNMQPTAYYEYVGAYTTTIGQVMIPDGSFVEVRWMRTGGEGVYHDVPWLQSTTDLKEIDGSEPFISSIGNVTTTTFSCHNTDGSLVGGTGLDVVDPNSGINSGGDFVAMGIDLSDPNWVYRTSNRNRVARIAKPSSYVGYNLWALYLAFGVSAGDPSAPYLPAPTSSTPFPNIAKFDYVIALSP